MTERTGGKEEVEPSAEKSASAPPASPPDGKTEPHPHPGLPPKETVNQELNANLSQGADTIATSTGTQPTIEADENSTLDENPDTDNDSAYGDEIASLTTSLNSTVTNFKYENGRRYHAQEDARYFLPNDDTENDRLDLFHHLLTLRCDDRLHLAPIGPNPQRILDLGTGTGIWAIQMGDAYPSAEVLGNDLSPVQPTLVPTNVSFEVDDIESTWVFSRPFDYIHCRYLAGSIRNWPRLISQAFKHVKPGGWVEFQDFDMQFYSTDGTFVKGSSPDVWTNEIVEALKVFGMEPEPGPKLEAWVREAGFVDVNHVLLPIPVGVWPRDRIMKEIGACDLSMFLEGLEAISLRAMTNGRGWSAEEVLAFLPSVRKNLCNRRIHALHNFHVVWAQKPFEE